MIRAFLTTGAPIDLPAETPCLPWDDHDTRRLLLSEIRSDAPWLWSAQVPDDIAAHHQRPKGWRPRVRVETWEEESLRLRAERDAEKARADAAERKLARAVEFAFCEGALNVRGSHERPEGWEMGGGAFARSRGLTLAQAFTRAEELERNLGYHLPADEVLARCKTALKAAGWEACANTSTASDTIFRPTPSKITTAWVSFPRAKRAPEEHRLAAARAALRLMCFGIKVDLSR